MSDSDEIFAHEIGHAMGLDHVDGTNNLMNTKYDDPTSLFLTEEQIDRARSRAWELRHCRQQL